jgi:hypothetical protein
MNFVPNDTPDRGVNWRAACLFKNLKNRYSGARNSDQGDQIGRFFSNWAIVFFEQFFENYNSSLHFGILFSSDKELFWATFWAIFSQTHPVTLTRVFSPDPALIFAIIDPNVVNYCDPLSSATAASASPASSMVTKA